MSCCTSVSPVSTTCTLTGGPSVYIPGVTCQGSGPSSNHRIPDPTDCSDFEDACKCEDCPAPCKEIITNNTTSTYSWSFCNIIGCCYSCVTTYILSCKYCIPIYRPCPTTTTTTTTTGTTPPPGDCEGAGSA